MNLEPSLLEIALTKLAFVIAGEPVYKEYADSIPINGNENVLDFGSGMGTVASFVVQRLPDGHLTCYDVSERWLNACRKNLRRVTNVSYHKGETATIGLKEESFDIIYCHYVLHDISEYDLERTIYNLVRLLKSGGILTFREPLRDKEKLRKIKTFAYENGLCIKDSRITDVPFMGNALESLYIKV